MNINDFIEERKDLNITKWVAPKRSAVYFICEKDGEIVYIGTTMNLQSRLTTQDMKVKFHQKPTFFFLQTKESCEDLEKELIFRIKPKYNNQWTHRAPEVKKKHKKYKAIPISEKIKMANVKGESIASIMTERNMSQTELAILMKVSRQRIHQIIKDKRSLRKKTIKKLEKALGVKLYS